jgi:hypothetical protein
MPMYIVVLRDSDKNIQVTILTGSKHDTRVEDLLKDMSKIIMYSANISVTNLDFPSRLNIVSSF